MLTGQASLNIVQQTADQLSLLADWTVRKIEELSDEHEKCWAVTLWLG
jgi:hypothetical protein